MLKKRTYDFIKIDKTGKLALIYDAILTQLALKKKRFVLSRAINAKAREKEDELLADFISSKTALICYDTSEVNSMLSAYRKLDDYKLYLSDTGLFTSMIFDNGNGTEADIYNKLLSDKLGSNLGYLYENVVAQMIRASGRDLYYHTWQKNNSTHHYEIDFLISEKTKVIPIEVKSSSIKQHASMDALCEKYSHVISRRFLFSQKDIGHDQMLELLPVHLLETLLKEL